MMPRRTHLCLAACALSICCSLPGQTVQLAADRQALKAATSEKDPTHKLELLHQFLHDYPDSRQAAAAHKAIFTTLVASFPDREKEIRKEGDYRIDHAATPEDKADAENDLAYTLAEAKPNGVALPVAEAWIQKALSTITEADSNRYLLAQTAQSDPEHPPTAQTLHAFYAHVREARIQTLGEIYLHEGKLLQAKQTVAEGMALKSDDGGLYDTKGMIAYAEHENAAALDNLELASLYGGITEPSTAVMMQLYRQSHGGNDATFTAHMDERYKQVFPATPPATRAAITNGHTALIELFTGSGCGPCVAADLAVDDALAAYPGKEVVALEFDQHIPLPDPLANPDGVQRAAYYGVQYTPWLVLDGTSRDLDGFGGERTEEHKMYDRLGTALDAEIPVNYTVGLTLTAAANASGVVTANASVSVASPAALTKALKAAAKRNAADAALVQQQAEQMREMKKARGTAESAPVATAASSASTALVLNFALAQDDLRYSGENGVRFHRMVVRAVSKPSAAAFPVDLHGPTEATTTFDTAAISKSLSDYLDSFSKHSERFGTTSFLSKDTTMPPDHLYVVAWVADPTTHQVVQSAVVPVTPHAQTAAVAPNAQPLGASR